MSARAPSLSETAEQSFRGEVASANDPFAAPPAANDQDTEVPGLALRKLEDLIIDVGNGSEESVAYHLYLGTSLRNKGTLLVARFATRTVVVEGRNLRGLRDALSSRRCALLRISDRVDQMNAQHSRAPVITSLRVLTPKQGDELLAAELAAQDPPSQALGG